MVDCLKAYSSLLLQLWRWSASAFMLCRCLLATSLLGQQRQCPLHRSASPRLPQGLLPDTASHLPACLPAVWLQDGAL